MGFPPLDVADAATCSATILTQERSLAIQRTEESGLSIARELSYHRCRTLVLPRHDLMIQLRIVSQDVLQGRMAPKYLSLLRSSSSYADRLGRKESRQPTSYDPGTCCMST